MQFLNFHNCLGQNWAGKLKFLWQKGRGKEDRSKCKSVFDMQEFHSFPALFSGKKNENAQLTQNTIKHLATEYHPFSQKFPSCWQVDSLTLH